ncbi:MAG: BRO family protein [Lachnospiraceae bacterium]|nr:BRO family protein [Lachnospiraceae bacterium]
MNELLVFNNETFGQIRTVMIGGEPHFVGKDVAAALGYADTFGALKKHVEDDDKLVCQIGSAGQRRDVTVINESGLYSLILSSKLPTAKQFKHWVTSEVLPSIRKNGGYISGQEESSPEEIMARALIVANKVIAEKQAVDVDYFEISVSEIQTKRW